MTNSMDLPSVVRDFSASSNDYRLFFVVALFGAFAWWVMKKFIDMQAASHAEALTAMLEAGKIRDRVESLCRDLAVSIDRNTEGFKVATAVMTECSMLQKETQKALDKLQT